MVLQWFERNQEFVAEALQRGERPDMATTMDSGSLDDLVALHDELGVFEVLDNLPVDRRRRDIEDRLLLRTLPRDLDADVDRLDDQRTEAPVRDVIEFIGVEVEREVLLAEEREHFERLIERSLSLCRREIPNEGQMPR